MVLSNIWHYAATMFCSATFILKTMADTNDGPVESKPQRYVEGLKYRGSETPGVILETPGKTSTAAFWGEKPLNVIFHLQSSLKMNFKSLFCPVFIIQMAKHSFKNVKRVLWFLL